MLKFCWCVIIATEEKHIFMCVLYTLCLIFIKIIIKKYQQLFKIFLSLSNKKLMQTIYNCIYII